MTFRASSIGGKKPRSPLGPPPFGSIDWSRVRSHYQQRVGISQRLRRLHKEDDRSSFAKLLLGIDDPHGNYSAAEHHLGPLVLGDNSDAQDRIHRFASDIMTLDSPRHLPSLIQRTALRYLGIGVGSEASCLLRPREMWVANTRTLWSHLLMKHKSVSVANEELALYRDREDSSEMAYRKWVALHRELGPHMVRLSKIGAERAVDAGVQPGTLKYLWADAIANEQYERYAP